MNETVPFLFGRAGAVEGPYFLCAQGFADADGKVAAERMADERHVSGVDPLLLAHALHEFQSLRILCRHSPQRDADVGPDIFAVPETVRAAEGDGVGRCVRRRLPFPRVNFCKKSMLA